MEPEDLEPAHLPRDECHGRRSDSGARRSQLAELEVEQLPTKCSARWPLRCARFDGGGIPGLDGSLFGAGHRHRSPDLQSRRHWGPVGNRCPRRRDHYGHR